MRNNAPFLLIDADVLAYQAAAGVEKIVCFDVCLPVASLSDALAAFDVKLNRLLHTLRATEYRLCFSDADLFRRKLFPTYKRNREGKPRPIILKTLREHLLRETPAAQVCLKPGLEADDCMGILATRRSYLPGRRKVVVSIDKDLRTIPGLFYNPARPEDGVQTITPASADFRFMMQALTGDAVDGYPGCPKVGPATAAKLFQKCMEEVLSDPAYDDADMDNIALLWPVVLSAYEKAGFNADYALTQARVARILRAEDYDFKNSEVKLWTPPHP